MTPLFRFFAVLLITLSISAPSYAGVIELSLEKQLKALPPNKMLSLIVTMKTRANTGSIKFIGKKQRRSKIIQALHEHATLKQASLLTFLTANGGTEIKELWLINSVAVKLPKNRIRALAKQPGVAEVFIDSTLSLPTSPTSSLANPEWNLSAIHAPELWTIGKTGQGVVVANMDTGVDRLHPDLSQKWRGGTNSWYDPHGQHSSPNDYAGAVTGHGTQTMGIMVAGSAGGTAVGVAPDAKWIAAKLFGNDGKAQESDFHLSFQWLLDPDGNPLTNDTPDVINGSFQSSVPSICDTRFQGDIQALKTAGVAVVFAAGNSGPAIATSGSPANNPGSFSAGAVDFDLNLAPFSARGPTPTDCGSALFPNVVAPGVDIVTTDITSTILESYAVVSGTSFAAPHVAGSMALLAGAFPNVEVTALEAALQDSATDLGLPGADNEYGYGLLNVANAYDILANSSQNPVGIDDNYILDEDSTLTIPAPGVLSNDSDPQSNPLSVSLVSDVAHGSLSLDASGSFNYTPSVNFYGTDSFTYQISDGLHDSGITTDFITVNPINDAPVAQADNVTVSNGETISIAVLANDSDIESSPITPVIDTNPQHGVITIDPEGRVIYAHDGSQTTEDSFTYHVTDGDMTSNVVSVNISISPAPAVSTPDNYVIDEDTSFNAVAPGVLINDSPATGLSAQLISNPAHAAQFNLNADGSFNYVPLSNFNGTDSFSYKAVVNANSQSIETPVTITINAINDAPVAANDGLYTVVSGQILTVPATSGVLINDTDIENDNLSSTLVTHPSSGLLQLTNDGGFSFNAIGLAPGLYSFTYLANDGMPVNNSSNIANVAIEVKQQAINTAPVANPDLFLFRPNVLRTVDVAGELGLGVLSNDNDAERNPLAAQLVANSQIGGGQLTLSPSGLFTFFKKGPESGSFRYRANDGNLLSLPNKGIKVNLVADAPPKAVADNCTYDISTNEATQPTICNVISHRTVEMAVAQNDTDANQTTNIPTDGAGTQVVKRSAIVTWVGTGVNVMANSECNQTALGNPLALRGSLTNNCNGTFTVAISAGNQQKNIEYNYRISDDLGAQSSAKLVTLTVQP